MGAGSQGWEGEGAPEGFARRGWVWLSPALCWAWHGLEPPSLRGDTCGTRVGPVWPGMAEGSGAWGWLEHSLQWLCEETPAKAEIRCLEGAVAWTGLAPVPHP